MDSNNIYPQNVFSWSNKVYRIVWIVVWSILCRWTPAPLHRWRICILRIFGAQIGNRNSVYPSCNIWSPNLLKTGDYSTIGPFVEIYNPGGLELGDYAILSQHSYLCGATHDYNVPDFTYVKKKIVIRAYSWICAKAIVLPGVICGEGSVLGAGSVATKNLDCWTVYSGSPARKVKDRKKVYQRLDSI